MELAGKPALRIVPSKVDSSGMPSEKFLEVGKFKEKLLADKATDQLTQKGFPAAVVQKTRFLSKSFQVLVGPYGTDTEAEAVHKDLASMGFTPRSYERGKRDLNMPPGMKVGSNHLPDGFCVISWESYIPDAIVKVEDDNGRGVSVEGKWVRQGAKFTQNAIAYQRNRDGSRTLLEIRFAGMNQALVFGTVSN
jgi:SPOR domain